jgi:hypothetical protein
MLIGMVGVTMLSTFSALNKPPGWYQGFDPTSQALTGLALGTLAIGVLGALSVTGEYGTGTIRSSLSAAPRRTLLLMGKILVIGIFAVVVGEILTLICFWTGQAVLGSGHAPTADLAQAGVLRAVVLSGAFLGLLGLLGLGLGVIIRHTAGAIAAYVGCTFLLPLLLSAVPGRPTRFTPIGILANSVSSVIKQPGLPSPLFGFVLMGLYCLPVLAVGVFLMIRRDA